MGLRDPPYRETGMPSVSWDPWWAFCFLRVLLIAIIHMQYAHIWDKTLSKDEKVEYEFSVGSKYITFSLIMWGIISLPFVLAIIGVIMFLVALFYFGFYVKKANTFAFTNKRVLIHRGWLSTRMISVDYSKITDVHVSEGFFERVLTHTGTLAIVTAGSTSDQIVLKHIDAPYELKKKLDHLKDGK